MIYFIDFIYRIYLNFKKCRIWNFAPKNHIFFFSKWYILPNCTNYTFCFCCCFTFLVTFHKFAEEGDKTRKKIPGFSTNGKYFLLFLQFLFYHSKTKGGQKETKKPRWSRALRWKKCATRKFLPFSICTLFKSSKFASSSPFINS